MSGEPRWMAVEVYGHRKHVGLVSEVSQFGATMMHVEALQADGSFVGLDYGGGAIFSTRPCTEEAARREVVPQGWNACESFAQPSAMPGLCATCGKGEPQHEAVKAKALPPRREPDEDDIPFGATREEPEQSWDVGEVEEAESATRNLRDAIYFEVSLERIAQDRQWGGPAKDDERSRFYWAHGVFDRATKAETAVTEGDTADFRRRMVQVAALAVAAIESHDRMIAVEVPCG